MQETNQTPENQVSQDKTQTPIDTIIEAITKSPVFDLPGAIVSFGRFLEKLPDIIELAKSPEKVLALSQFYGNIVNTTVNGYLAATEASKVPTAPQISELLLTLQKITYLNDWQKQFFLMHFTGVHVQFLGTDNEGHVVIVSQEPGRPESSEEPTKKPEDKEPPEPHIPETGL
jgi:hypothetical protein